MLRSSYTMIPLSYTVTLGQENTFRRIEMLRAEILTTVISQQDELSLTWHSLLTSVQGALNLAGNHYTLESLERSLLHTPRGSKNAMGELYTGSLRHINEFWTGTREEITVSHMEKLYTLLSGRGYRSASPSWTRLLPEFTTTLTYINSRREHPIIQSAIIGVTPFLYEQQTQFIRLFGVLLLRFVLSKYGFTCRGLTSPEAVWASQATSFYQAIASISRTGNLNHWVLFMTQALEESLTQTSSAIQTHLQKEIASHAKSIPMLHNRHKRIIALLDTPGVVITNQRVAQRFGVSQVTASRDLAKLLSLGLIFSHGSGRSTAYSKA